MKLYFSNYTKECINSHWYKAFFWFLNNLYLVLILTYLAFGGFTFQYMVTEVYTEVYITVRM